MWGMTVRLIKLIPRFGKIRSNTSIQSEINYVKYMNQISEKSTRTSNTYALILN